MPSFHVVRRKSWLASIGLLMLGCSWSRFDDVSKSAPVVALKKPGKLEHGFGVGLSTIALEDSVRVLSMGSPPRSQGAVFELGRGERPGVDSNDTGHCDPDLDRCFSISTPVGLARASARGVREHCFITGVGSADDQPGLVGRCGDDVNYELPVPDSVFPYVIGPALVGEPPDEGIFLSTDRAEAPAVVAGVPSRQVAFYYEPLDDGAVARGRVPRDLPFPGDHLDESYGTTMASIRIPGGRVFAVGAPEEQHVWLFRWREGDEQASFIGCLGGTAGFGRTLGGGRVWPPADGDDETDEFDELIVSDATKVTVFNGADLAQLPTTDQAACSLASLPPGGLVASFGCGSTKGIEGCQDSDFGAAIAVGDLDGDGDGEVLVGAPDMTARGKSRAGAVLIYDVEGDVLHEFKEVLFASSAETNDGLGRSIATPSIEGRDIVAAAGPANEKVLLFYCPEMLPEDIRSTSTRCQ